MEPRNKQRFLIIGAIIVILLVVAGFAIFSSKKSNQAGKSSNSSALFGPSVIPATNETYRFLSNLDDPTYIYKFDQKAHKLYRLNRQDFKQAGNLLDFFYVAQIGPKDPQGNTFILGAQSDKNVTQNYLCDFSSPCRPIDINISQVLLSPDNQIMVVKYQDSKYQFGYYEPASDKLTPVYALDAADYEIRFTSKDTAIFYATTSTNNPAPISILSLSGKKIIKQVDQALYFVASPDGSEIVYAKKEADKLNVYAYSTKTDQKVNLGEKNFHGFFFSPNSQLYEISPDNSGTLIKHDLSSDKDQTEQVKSLSIPNQNPVTEILWLSGSNYLMTFSDSKTQQFTLTP